MRCYPTLTPDGVGSFSTIFQLLQAIWAGQLAVLPLSHLGPLTSSCGSLGILWLTMALPHTWWAVLAVGTASMALLCSKWLHCP